MDLTIKQLASQLKVSRPTVEVRMNHIPGFRDKYTKKRGNKIMVNQEGCQLISKNQTSPHYDHSHHSQTPSHRGHTIVFKVLRNQNSEQGNMIKAQEQTIKKLTKLLDQQQQLQLSTQTENKHLKRRVKKLTHVSTSNAKQKVIAFNNRNLSSIGKIAHSSHPNDETQNMKQKPLTKKAKAKKQKKMRHHKFWRRFFGK